MKQRLRDDACCNPGTGSEPRIPNAAAQTRIVSGGAFWPSQGELSRHLKYIARARIPEFESHHLSLAVPLSSLDT